MVPLEPHWRCWAVGCYWDYDQIGLNLGPFGIHWQFLDNQFERLCQIWRLFRIVIHRWRMDIRLEVDSNIWRVGYMMAAPWDHGVYFGPLFRSNMMSSTTMSIDHVDAPTISGERFGVDPAAVKMKPRPY